MSDLHWKQSITNTEPNKISLRGYPVEELMGKVSFSDSIYLALQGDLPSPEISKLFEAILVSSVDHGVTSPSALAALTATSTGAPMNAAVAAGLLSINKFHGGAIEDAMHIFLEIKEITTLHNIPTADAADQFVEKYHSEGRRIMGYGHRIHSNDPRQEKLFKIARETDLAGEYIVIAGELQTSLGKQIGKELPINVDGAIAAILCDLEFPPELANALFMIARVPGLVAHVAEEKTRYKPMRKIHPTDHEYDGPAERHLEE